MSAEASEQIKEAARANNLSDFTAYLGRVLDELFIERMEGNEEIFSKIMTDREFRSAASEHLAFEIFEKSRVSRASDGATS